MTEQETLLQMIEGSKPYGDGIIFHNGSCIVTVNKGYDANKAKKWYFGQMTIDNGKLYETVRTGCFSYTRKPFISELGEVEYDMTPVENYPLPRAMRAKSFANHRYDSKSVDSWEEYETLADKVEQDE